MQKCLPSVVPEEFSEQAIKLHANPSLWWISEMLRYLFREMPETAEMFEQRTRLDKPIAAIHVRRSDKSKEAPYQPVEAYMKHVEEFFEQIEIKNGKKLEEKRVFVASDDPKILDECRQKFPGLI